MKRILLADDETDILNLVSEWLDDELPDIEIITAETGDAAVEILENQAHFDLIICDYYMPKGNGGVVHKYNYEHDKVPFIFLTGAFINDLSKIENLKVDNKKNFIVLKPYDEESFLVKIKSALDCDGLEGLKYQKIQTSFVDSIIGERIDVFCRISDEKFIKINDKESELSAETIDKYKDREDRYLYLLESDYKIFLDKKETSLKNSYDPSESLDVVAEVLDFVHHILHTLGVEKKHIDLMDRCVTNCIEQSKKDEVLFPHISKLITERAYITSHSILSLHISGLLASKLNLDSDKVLNKLSYASLFQNLYLLEETQARIYDLEDNSYVELRPRERNKVLNHGRQIAKSIQESSLLDSDIPKLIENHHERPLGKGFPRNIDSKNLSVLSGVFNISIVIADHICLKGHSKESLNDLVGFLSENYDSGVFKKPLIEFCSLVNKLK